jgi:5'-nucleotidase
VFSDALVVSGINYGPNLGTEVTISGTVGAALEAGAFSIPGIAVSLEMDSAYHLTGDKTADYTAAKAFTQQFARRVLRSGLMEDVHALNLNIPRDASPTTPWRTTRLSRFRYFLPLAPDRSNGSGRPGYTLFRDHKEAEPDSDVRAMLVDRIVSVTGLSLDLTSRQDLSALDARFRGRSAVGLELRDQWLFPVQSPRVASLA